MEEKKITPDGGMNLDFSKSPVLWKFLNDDSFIKSIMGPVGSGKSYACCAELFRRAVMQKPSPRDGIKYSRFAVVRNSYPMLKTTTLKTWLELFPEDVWGNVHHAPPIRLLVRKLHLEPFIDHANLGGVLVLEEDKLGRGHRGALNLVGAARIRSGRRWRRTAGRAAVAAAVSTLFFEAHVARRAGGRRGGAKARFPGTAQ